MTFPYLKLSCLALLLLSVSSFAEKTEEKKPESENNQNIEETLVFGTKRGNFTVITKDTQKLVDLPGALGDPISAVYSLPGVVNSGGRNGEPAVRGSSPADNVYIVDGIPAAYIFHEFTNSIFSEFIIQDFELYSAAFGPQFADATGAVFDIKLRQPAQQDIFTIVDLSLLRSGVFVEGSVTENSAFYLSARKSFLHLVIPEGTEEEGIRIVQVPRDEDYQFKYSWELVENHNLTLSANGASDIAEASFSREADFVRSNPDFAGDATIDNNFDGQSLAYTYYKDTNNNFDFIVGRTDQNYAARWGDAYYNLLTTERNLIKTAYSKSLNSRFTLSAGALHQNTDFGINYDQVLFTCTEFEPDCSLNRRDRTQDSLGIDIVDQSIYIDAAVQTTERLGFDIGLQWHTNDYNDESFTHPRISSSYKLSENYQLQLKYGTYDRLAEPEFIFPQIGNPNLKSLTAEHTSLGISRAITNSWGWDIDFYYKTLDNLPLALTGDEPGADQFYSNDVTGEAYGVDILINKETGKWYGWVALSYGKSNRTNTRTDLTKNYYLDTPFLFNWVTNYQFKSNMNIGWRFTVRSGSAYTPIVGVQENPFFEDSVLPEYGDPFSDRLPLYSRLDLRYKWDFRLWNNDAALIVDIINVLNQENVTDRSLDYDRVDSVDDEVQTTDSVSPGIIPTFGLRYSF